MALGDYEMLLGKQNVQKQEAKKCETSFEWETRYYNNLAKRVPRKRTTQKFGTVLRESNFVSRGPQTRFQNAETPLKSDLRGKTPKNHLSTAQSSARQDT